MTALSNLLALLSLDDSDYLAGLVSNQTATASFATKLSSIGGAVVIGGLTAAATAIGAVGVAAWEAGNTMDDAMDRIATSTGATGPELDGLRDDFEAVFTSVPTDAGAAAEAISILNSRLDITGPGLQNLASPLLEVTRILGGDLATNAEAFTRVMGDWNLPVEDASASLDALFVAAQETGAPLDQLMQRVVQYGAPMRNFGFSFKQAGAILAAFEAQGVNTEIVMSGLRIAQGKFIMQGKDMNTGLWETVDAIQNATEAEGLKIATDIFGTKAAGDMFDTIRSGKFDVDELTTAMMNADGAIMETAASTMDWGEKWTIFKNKITTALAPIGESMMAGVGKAMDAVVAIFERPDVQAGLTKFTTMIGSFITQAVSYIPILIDGFFQFISFLQNNQGIVIGILAALGVAAMAWGVTTAAAAITAMAPMLPVIAVLLLIGAAVYLLYEAWTNNWGGIQEKVAAVWAALQPVFDRLKAWLAVAIPAALQILKTWWDITLNNLRMMWSFLQTYVFPILGALANLVGSVLSVVFRAWVGILQNVTIPMLQFLWQIFQDKVLPVIKTVAGWLADKLGPAFRGIGSAVSWVIDWINRLADKLRNIKLPAWMTPHSPTPWEMGLRGVSDAMQSLTRSQLPTFQAALQLQAQPIGASGSIDIQPRGASSSQQSAFSGLNAEGSNDALMRDIQRLLRDLPGEIVKATRDDRLRRSA